MEFYSEKTIFDKLASHFNVFNPIDKQEGENFIEYWYRFEGTTGRLEATHFLDTNKYEVKFYRRGKHEKIYPVSYSEICTVLDEFLK